jgi:hypothetical protein
MQVGYWWDGSHRSLRITRLYFANGSPFQFLGSFVHIRVQLVADGTKIEIGGVGVRWGLAGENFMGVGICLLSLNLPGI